MKKILLSILLISFSITITSCGESEKEKKIRIENETRAKDSISLINGMDALGDDYIKRLKKISMEERMRFINKEIRNANYNLRAPDMNNTGLEESVWQESQLALNIFPNKEFTKYQRKYGKKAMSSVALQCDKFLEQKTKSAEVKKIEW